MGELTEKQRERLDDLFPTILQWISDTGCECDEETGQEAAEDITKHVCTPGKAEQELRAALFKMEEIESERDQSKSYAAELFGIRLRYSQLRAAYDRVCNDDGEHL